MPDLDKIRALTEAVLERSSGRVHVHSIGNYLTDDSGFNITTQRVWQEFMSEVDPGTVLLLLHEIEDLKGQIKHMKEAVAEYLSVTMEEIMARQPPEKN